MSRAGWRTGPLPLGVALAASMLPWARPAVADMAPPPVTVPSSPMPGVGRALSELLAEAGVEQDAAPRLVTEEAEVHVYPELVHVRVRWEIEAEEEIPPGFLMGLPDAHPTFAGPPIEALVVRVDGEEVSTGWRGGWFHPEGPRGKAEANPFWWKGWLLASWRTWPLPADAGQRVVVTAEYLRLIEYDWWDREDPPRGFVRYDWERAVDWAGELDRRRIEFAAHGPRLTGELEWSDPTDVVGVIVEHEAPFAAPRPGPEEPAAVALMRRSVHVVALQPDPDALAALIDEVHVALDGTDPLERAVARRVLEALDEELRQCASFLDHPVSFRPACSPRYSREEAFEEGEEPPPEEYEGEADPSGPRTGEDAELRDHLESARAIVWRDDPRHAWTSSPNCGRPVGEDGREELLDEACQAHSQIVAGNWQALYSGDRDAWTGSTATADALLALAERERTRRWWWGGAVFVLVVGLAGWWQWRRIRKLWARPDGRALPPRS